MLGLILANCLGAGKEMLVNGLRCTSWCELLDFISFGQNISATKSKPYIQNWTLLWLVEHSSKLYSVSRDVGITVSLEELK